MSISCNKTSQGVRSHLVSPPPWAEKMIQCSLFKWKSNISSPASHTRYLLLSVTITHMNMLLTGWTVPVHTISPHSQQALSFSPAHAYRGESQVIGIQPGLKLHQNLYQQTEKPATTWNIQHIPLPFCQYPLVFPVPLHTCMNRCAQTHTYRAQTAASKSPTALTHITDNKTAPISFTFVSTSFLALLGLF